MWYLPLNPSHHLSPIHLRSNEPQSILPPSATRRRQVGPHVHRPFDLPRTSTTGTWFFASSSSYLCRCLPASSSSASPSSFAHAATFRQFLHLPFLCRHIVSPHRRLAPSPPLLHVSAFTNLCSSFSVHCDLLLLLSPPPASQLPSSGP
jgi:hypothetical protein